MGPRWALRPAQVRLAPVAEELHTGSQTGRKLALHAGVGRQSTVSHYTCSGSPVAQAAEGFAAL